MCLGEPGPKEDLPPLVGSATGSVPTWIDSVAQQGWKGRYAGRKRSFRISVGTLLGLTCLTIGLWTVDGTIRTEAAGALEITTPSCGDVEFPSASTGSWALPASETGVDVYSNGPSFEGTGNDCVVNSNDDPVYNWVKRLLSNGELGAGQAWLPNPQRDGSKGP